MTGVFRGRRTLLTAATIRLQCERRTNCPQDTCVKCGTSHALSGELIRQLNEQILKTRLRRKPALPTPRACSVTPSPAPPCVCDARRRGRTSTVIVTGSSAALRTIAAFMFKAQHQVRLRRDAVELGEPDPEAEPARASRGHIISGPQHFSLLLFGAIRLRVAWNNGGAGHRGRRVLPRSTLQLGRRRRRRQVSKARSSP
jgi:hypothetical protein